MVACSNLGFSQTSPIASLAYSAPRNAQGDAAARPEVSAPMTGARASTVTNDRVLGRTGEQEHSSQSVLLGEMVASSFTQRPAGDAVAERLAGERGASLGVGT